MNWLTDLFTNGESIAHILILYALVISFGVLLGKVKIGGISLGVTFVLFVGIVAGHILHINNIEEPQLVMNFIQDFGLILFVYSIGLQVGPSFFTSFKQGGIKMNAIALGIILCNIIVTLGLYYGFCDKNAPQSLPMMVGVLCGVYLSFQAPSLFLQCRVVWRYRRMDGVSEENRNVDSGLDRDAFCYTIELFSTRCNYLCRIVGDCTHLLNASPLSLALRVRYLVSRNHDRRGNIDVSSPHAGVQL